MQKSRRFLLLAAIVIFSLALYFLIGGYGWLVSIPFNFWEIPIGNLLTWIGLMAWLALPVLWCPRALKDSIFYNILHKGALLVAVLWPFITYLLAGNWSMSFGKSDVFRGSPEAAEYAFGLTGVLAAFPILSALGLGIWFLASLLNKRSRVG